MLALFGLASCTASGDYYANANLETQYGGLQFVTFHYTAGMVLHLKYIKH